MFIGSYYNKLEGKGRLCLPKQFRDQNSSANWVITSGLDGGLFVFPEHDFERELIKLSQLEFTKANQRNFIRLMTNQAQPVTADQAGRILIADHLLNLAQITKDLVVVGSLTRLEIWDQTTYHQLLDQLNQTASSIAEGIEWGNGRPTDSLDNSLPSPRSGV